MSSWSRTIELRLCNVRLQEKIRKIRRHGLLLKTLVVGGGCDSHCRRSPGWASACSRSRHGACPDSSWVISQPMMVVILSGRPMMRLASRSRSLSLGGTAAMEHEIVAELGLREGQPTGCTRSAGVKNGLKQASHFWPQLRCRAGSANCVSWRRRFDGTSILPCWALGCGVSRPQPA
jgi:hypothetical protein